MTKPRSESAKEARLRANRLLGRILEDLAEEGLLERVVAADGTDGYRITEAGCDFLDQHDRKPTSEAARPNSVPKRVA